MRTVTVRGWQGVAFTVLGVVRKTNGRRLRVVMVGDDQIHEVDAAACTKLARREYCGVCGQVGCAHNG